MNKEQQTTRQTDGTEGTKNNNFFTQSSVPKPQTTAIFAGKMFFAAHGLHKCDFAQVKVTEKKNHFRTHPPNKKRLNMKDLSIGFPGSP